MDNNFSNLQVLIADDHALVRSGLSLLIKMISKDAKIIEANQFEEVLSILSTNPSIDLILLDVMMPDNNSLSGAQYICKNWPEIPIVIISVKEDLRSIRLALKSGIMGYIPKSSSPNVTVNAIRLVLSGGVYVPPHVLSQGQESPLDDVQAPSIILSDANGLSNSGVLKITSRQKDVLELLTLGKSNKEIAKVLGLKPGTIKMHTSRIFKLLGVSNRTEAVTTYAKHLDNYPKQWSWRGYNEQLIIASLLLSNNWEIKWSSHYVSTKMQKEFNNSILSEIPMKLGAIETSLWLKKN